MALFPKDALTTEYLFYFYEKFGNWLAFKFCQGTKQQSYSGTIARKLPIIYPPDKEEQHAIATVLTDMDAELNALEQKRDKTKAIKQGMMQELLTGRIRLT
jgi:type I restriction enzyme S subunit